MFFPANNQNNIKLIMRGFGLLIVMLLLAVTNAHVQAMSNPETSDSAIFSEAHQTDALYELTLTYNCQENAQQEWVVGNANSFEISYEWFLSTGESGSGVVPALGTDSFLTDNMEQMVTIKYTFPLKEVCGDEKCGETEIIKLSVSSSTCPINTQETNSSEPSEEYNQVEETPVTVFSHQTKQNCDSAEVSHQTRFDILIKTSAIHSVKTSHQWFSTQLFCGLEASTPELS